MRHLTWLLAAAAAVIAGPARAASTPSILPVKACESLSKLDLAGFADAPVHITRALLGKFRGVDACVVEGFVEPAVKFVVNLPPKDWSGRFLQVGCGGLCGHIPDEYAQTHGCAALDGGGMAVAMTDMGHEGPGPEFGDDPRLREDFAFRGVHETAAVAKAIVAAFYGRSADHSYFLGCSDGGREGLMEAEHFPADFDGITAGEPAMNFLIQNTFYHAWNALRNTAPDGKPILAAADLPALHRAALSACHAEDGVIADPLRCAFDPAAAACKAGETADCLSPAQVETARAIYAGPRDAAGLALTPGGPQPGSELSWAGVFVPKPGSDFIFGRVIAGGAIEHLAFAPGEGAGLKLEDLRFDAATYEKMLPRHALYDATNPDISAFAKRGGKLILWHGLSDPHISPWNSIAYYQGVENVLGEAARNSARLFLLPGVYHCEGGEGPVQTDVLSAILDWVEQGKAPDALIMRGAGVSRPVFPFPALAAYRGTGDKADAASYVAARPDTPLKVRAWIGEALFAPPAK
jgi:feruloyl esterase